MTEHCKTGERIEIRLRFRGNSAQLQKIEQARKLLEEAGFCFSYNVAHGAIDWYLENEICVGKQPEALFVGKWSTSNKYYTAIRECTWPGCGDPGHRGPVVTLLHELEPVKPNYPNFFGRLKKYWSDRFFRWKELRRLKKLRESIDWNQRYRLLK